MHKSWDFTVSCTVLLPYQKITEPKTPAENPFFCGNSLFISKLGAMVVVFKSSTFNPKGSSHQNLKIHFLSTYDLLHRTNT